MKKLLMLLLMACIATGCTDEKTKDLDKDGELLNGNDNAQTETLESEYYEIVTFTRLKELLEDDTTKLIYFGSDGCGACRSFKPIAQKYAKENNIHIYFVLLDNFSNEEYAELDEILYFDYIPYITVYQNKEFVYEQSGVHTYEQLDNLVKQYKIGD